MEKHEDVTKSNLKRRKLSTFTDNRIPATMGVKN